LEESVEPVKRTPTRKSYVPVNPSPLLRDITPKPVCKRESNLKAASKAKRICSDVVEESLVVESEEENETEVFSEVPIDVLHTTPKIKKTPR